MVQSSVDQWMSVADGSFALKSGEFIPADQITDVKTAYGTAVANTGKITEIALKAQREAASVLTIGFMASIEDMRTFSSKFG